MSKKVKKKTINKKKTVKKKKINRKKRKNPLSKLVLLLNICLIALCVYGFYYSSKHPILLMPGSTHVEFGQKYNAADTVSFVRFGKPENVEITSNVDDSKPGEYKTTYKYNDYVLDVDVEVKDSQPPIIETRDYTTDMIEEVKAKSFFKKIEDVSEVKTEIESMDKKNDNTYKVVVKATDASGNVSRSTVKLIREVDKEAPQFEFGDLEVYETDYFDLMENAKVKDNLDKKPKVTTNFDELEIKPGTLKVTYTATDRSGNKTEATRKIKVLESPEANEKNVYLTFDDGPSPITQEVLDVLDKYNVKATFFVTGNGQPYNDMIKKAYDAGHTIALHSYTHSYSTIYQSKEAYFEDLEKLSDMVYEITGERSKFIRFPGGVGNTISANYCEGIMTELSEEVTKRGYYYVDWNVNSGDADEVTAEVETIVAKATNYSGDHNFILMHDADFKPTTPMALPQIIEYYQSEGFTFRPISERSPVCHGPLRN